MSLFDEPQKRPDSKKDRLIHRCLYIWKLILTLLLVPSGILGLGGLVLQTWLLFKYVEIILGFGLIPLIAMGLIILVLVYTYPDDTRR